MSTRLPELRFRANPNPNSSSSEAEEPSALTRPVTSNVVDDASSPASATSSSVIAVVLVVASLVLAIEWIDVAVRASVYRTPNRCLSLTSVHRG
jgi:hypothetical protein